MEAGLTIQRNKKRRKPRGLASAQAVEQTLEERTDALEVDLARRGEGVRARREWWGAWRALLQTGKNYMRGEPNGAGVPVPQGAPEIPSPACEDLTSPTGDISLLCLGLGKVSKSADAKHQLVLLQDMVEHLQIDPAKVKLYDPLFTDVDLELFKRRGWRVLPRNELGAHTLFPSVAPGAAAFAAGDSSRGTLVYLPHCPRELYEALLRANWMRSVWSGLGANADEEAEEVPAAGKAAGCGAEGGGPYLGDNELDEATSDGGSGREDQQQNGLDPNYPATTPVRTGRVVLLANPLRDYVDKLTDRKARDEIPYMAALAPHLDCHILPDLPNHAAQTAYTSTALQFLPLDRADHVDWNAPREASEIHGSSAGESKAATERGSRTETRRGEVFTNEIGEEASLEPRDHAVKSARGGPNIMADEPADDVLRRMQELLVKA